MSNPRCTSKEMMIPYSYDDFSKEIKNWISTCVASRTKNSEGVALRRENELVDSNLSLKLTWTRIRRLGGSGQLVVILAEYIKNSNSKVTNIRFSYRPSHQMTVIENIFKKDYSRSVEYEAKKYEQEIDREISEIHRRVERKQRIKNDDDIRRWVTLVRKVNVLIKEEKRLQGWNSPSPAPGIVNTAIGMASKLRGSTALSAMEAVVNMKVDAIAKIGHKREVKESLSVATRNVENIMRQIKDLEKEIIRKYGKDEFDNFYLNAVRINSSHHYPAR